jgi:hypothetical protein
MSDDRRKTAAGIRALFLAHNASHELQGVYGYAIRAAGARPIPALLRVIAGKLGANSPLTVEERVFLLQLLPALAEGRDVREELRIDPRKVGHNPARTWLNAEIVHEIEERIPDGGVTKAIDVVAGIVGKSPDAVRGIWKRRKDKGQ